MSSPRGRLTTGGGRSDQQAVRRADVCPAASLIVELPLVDLGLGDVVLAAALALRPPGAPLVLHLVGVDAPGAPHIGAVERLCRRIAPEVDLESVRIVGDLAMAAATRAARAVVGPEGPEATVGVRRGDAPQDDACRSDAVATQPVRVVAGGSAVEVARAVASVVQGVDTPR